jgi:RNA polymerase-interacting CarD/CdnL/TRCF family regulator
MFYAIAIGVVVLAAYWLWGMGKMVRMNKDPDHLALARLLLKAGDGNDEELLAFLREQRWTGLQVADHVAHALTVAEKLYLADEYSRASRYAINLQDRYRSLQDGRLSSIERTQETSASNHRPPAQNVRPSADRPAERVFAPAAPTQPTPPPPPSHETKQRYGFRVNEFIVYPAHGVGQILAFEEQEIAGAKLELFVINFIKDKMTLRVPVKKVANVGMRKLSDPVTIHQVHRTLIQPSHIAKGSWSRRAQEYEAKINSGDLIAIAEVMRDLYRPAVDAGQSYSERQLYAAAIDRLAREVAIVQHITEEEAVKELENLVIARRRA